MSAFADRPPLEEQIAQWRGYLRRRRALTSADVDELEGHLRDQLTSLTDAGLASDEAFLIAVRRMGSLDAVAREFAREHCDRLWKQLVLPDPAAPSATGGRAELLVVLGLAILAAAGIKLPELFGHPLGADESDAFYVRNIPLLALTPLVAYFAWKRRLAARVLSAVALAFAATALLVNAYPLVANGHTLRLTALHLPIALWLGVGIAYAGGRRFAGAARMDFVRFSGELAIYYVLTALGGGVLTAFTVMMFEAIGTDAEWLAERWIVPCGAMGALVIASWLVEAKQSVVENMAPVLTRLFTPLFALLLLAFLATMAWTGRPIDIERNVLIAFDLLLVLVVGLVLYAVSARDPETPPRFFDGLQLLLIVSALAVDVLALAAIAARISEFGFTPNRVAALGENLILAASLTGSAWLYARVLLGRDDVAALERWQTAYLPVYSAWAAVVVVIFPPLFGFA